jgi:hypothetical protein
MKEMILSWLLGIAFGAICVTLYYDGFVADEYKKKVNEASKALMRADKEIYMKDQDIKILIQYLEEIKRHNDRIEKNI